MCIPERFIVMILICIFSFTFFCQTISPGAIQVDIIRVMNLTSGQYSGLFSVASWASLLDVLHGFLIEKWWGLKLASYIYIVINFIGGGLYIIASFIDNFWLLVFGRLVFGIACNPMFLTMNCYIIHWFDGKEVNLMFSVMVSVVWFGSAFIYFVSVRIVEYIHSFPWITDKMNLAITITSVTLVMTLAVNLSIGTIAYLYKKKEKPAVYQEDEDKLKQEIEDKKSIKSLISFHPMFWFYAVSAFLYFISIMSFFSLSQEFFRVKYKVTVAEASNLSSLFSIVAFAASPPIGFVLDLVGRNLVFFTVGLMFGVISHGLLAFTMVNPAVAVVLLAISAGISTCAWSMFQYIVEPHQYTTAYGVAQTVCNFAIAIGSIGAGYVADDFGYPRLCYFFFICDTVALVLLSAVWFFDLRMGRRLLLTAKERNERVEATKRLETSETNVTYGTNGQSTPPIERITKEELIE